MTAAKQLAINCVTKAANTTVVIYSFLLFLATNALKFHLSLQFLTNQKHIRDHQNVPFILK